LLATATFRSNTIKLWDTANGRELRNLSGGRQSGMSMSPFIAFSADSRLVAAAAGSNTVKVWDIASGRELQTLSTGEGGIASTLVGVYFLAFSGNDRVVTMSDQIRVWEVTTGKELNTIPADALNSLAFSGSDGGAALSLDGRQLARVTTDGDNVVRFIDLASGRETRHVKLPDKEIQSLELAFAGDGRVLIGAVIDTNEWSVLKFSRDGKMLAQSDGYTIKLWDLASGREVSVLKAPNSGMLTTTGRVFASFSDDGKRIATGGFDTPTIVWESLQGRV
jgi:WD40 repeat protein